MQPQILLQEMSVRLCFRVHYHGFSLQFRLLQRSQTNAVHAIEVTFDTLWKRQLVLMPVRCTLNEETNRRLALAMPTLGDTSHKVVSYLCSFLWNHADSQRAGLHLHQPIF